MEFVNTLSFEELRLILNRCGLFVVDDEKYFNDMKSEENNDELEQYYFRAIDCMPYKDDNTILLENLMKNSIYSPFENNEISTKFLDYSRFSSNIDIYSISDFILCRAFPIEIFDNEFPNARDLSLQDKFVSIMSETFKNCNYVNQYENFANAQTQNNNEIDSEKFYPS